MIKSIEIDENLENYISNNSYDLHPVQKEIIKHNNSLGEIKKMQISVTQAYFMQLLIKSKNLRECDWIIQDFSSRKKFLEDFS